MYLFMNKCLVYLFVCPISLFPLFGLNYSHIILLFLRHAHTDKSSSSDYPYVCMCKTPDISIFLLITSDIRMFQLTTYIIHLPLNAISNNHSLLFF